MGFKIKKEKGLEEGDYIVRLSDIQSTDGAFGPCLKFFFEVADGESAGHVTSMILPAKLISGNKLDKTLQLMGLDTSTIDDEIDADVLKDKLFKVRVENKTSAKGKVFANIAAIRVAQGTKVTPPVSLPSQASSSSRQNVPAPLANSDEVPF
jgi:hypothetical protein